MTFAPPPKLPAGASLCRRPALTFRLLRDRLPSWAFAGEGMTSPPLCDPARPTWRRGIRRGGVVERWNAALAAGRGALWSPTIRCAVIAGTPWLEVYCPGCRTSRAIDIRTIDRHPLASVGSLALGLRCSWCLLVRAGLATVTTETIKAGGRPIAVTRVRITDAGRKAIEG